MAAAGSLDALAGLPVLRKSELVARQAEDPPFGGLPVQNLAHVFQSPGPIYEPGGVSHDWWRMGRFLHAVGIGRGRHRAELLRLSPDARRHDLRERRARGGRGGAARRRGPDGAAGTRGARRRHDRLCRDAGLPEGDPRHGGGGGRALADHAGGGGRRRAVPEPARGICRSRHSLPAMLCHRRPRQHRLRERRRWRG
jgi:hypothetical protein